MEAWIDEAAERTVAIDVSASMAGILRSAWFEGFVSMLASRGVEELVLVDSEVRDIVPTARIADWLRNNRGGWTALAGAVLRLAGRNGRVLVVTDAEGIPTLSGLKATLAETEADEDLDVRVAVVHGRRLEAR